MLQLLIKRKVTKPNRQKHNKNQILSKNFHHHHHLRSNQGNQIILLLQTQQLSPSQEH